MSLEQLTTIDAISRFLDGTQAVAFSVLSDKQGHYRWVQKTLVKHRGIMTKQNDKRRYILSQSEINELYCLPRLNNIQREQCFSLTDEELSAVNQQSLLGSKIYFILLLGYFREKPIIAQFRFGEVKEDLKYVIDRYYPGQKLPRKDASQSQVYYLRKKMLDILHSRNLDSGSKTNLEIYLADVATICAGPRILFEPFAVQQPNGSLRD